MGQAGPSRIRRPVQKPKKPLMITVPRGLLRRSLQEILPNDKSRITFVISGSEIKLVRYNSSPFLFSIKLSPSKRWRFNKSHVQHLPPFPSRYVGFRNLRSPSPTEYCYEFEPGESPIFSPDHGRRITAPLSPTYAINPIIDSAPNSIYVPLSKQLPQNRKVMSKLARRRGVYIHPLTGTMKIVKRRSHSKLPSRYLYM
uniref:Ovule protein n=1 Tax=Elaeophora elaphi TaxID=1147741 RepID=A0A0R3RMC8_9BILA